MIIRIIMIRRIIMINRILMHILYDWKGRLHRGTLLDTTNIILYRVSIDTKNTNIIFCCEG